MQWWEIQITVPQEAVEALSAVLQSFPEISGVAIEGGTTPEPMHPEYGEFLSVDLLRPLTDSVIVTAYMPAATAKASLQVRLQDALQTIFNAGLFIANAMDTIRLSIVDEEDWAGAWKEGYHPMAIANRFIVIPKWDAQNAPSHHDRLPIILEPGMAFGTGTHETTQMCLEALEDVRVEGHRVLDVGCGTAVLAIGAARLKAKHVSAIDIDPVAVSIAKDNVYENCVNEVVDVRLGDLLTGFPADEPPFDVVVANILRDVVIALAPQVATRMQLGGRFITSGYIASQVSKVRNTLATYGFSVEKTYQKNDWIAITAVKTS